VWGLRSEGVELFGRSEALVSGLDHHLFLLDHMHEFDTGERPLGCVERFEPQHGPCHPLDCSMVLLDDIIEILELADGNRGAVLRIVALDGRSLAALPSIVIFSGTP